MYVHISLSRGLFTFAQFSQFLTGQSKPEWYYFFFLHFLFLHLVLTKFVCCQNSLKCKQRTDAFASGVGRSVGVHIGVQTCQTLHRVGSYEGCLTVALSSAQLVLRWWGPEQRFNLSYENICTRLAATDVIELKSGWQSHVVPSGWHWIYFEPLEMWVCV